MKTGAVYVKSIYYTTYVLYSTWHIEAHTQKTLLFLLNAGAREQ